MPYIKRKTPLKRSQKPLKRSATKKKPYKIKPISDKRKSQMQQYRAARLLFLKINPLCEVGLPGCTKNATELHHAGGRENKLLLDDTLWKAICRNCHNKITEDSAYAIEKGWSVSRLKSNK